MQWFRRILVHLCSVLLATPIGWCCWLPVVHADEKADEAKCCCTPKEKPVPSKQEAPQPSRSCCCEAIPVISSTSELTGKDPASALPAILVPSASLAAISLASSVLDPRSLHDPSPPLHLLHCLWLC